MPCPDCKRHQLAIEAAVEAVKEIRLEVFEVEGRYLSDDEAAALALAEVDRGDWPQDEEYLECVRYELKGIIARKAP